MDGLVVGLLVVGALAFVAWKFKVGPFKDKE